MLKLSAQVTKLEAMPQFCILFYANYTILATQRRAMAPCPPPKYAPAQHRSKRNIIFALLAHAAYQVSSAIKFYQKTIAFCEYWFILKMLHVKMYRNQKFMQISFFRKLFIVQYSSKRLSLVCSSNYNDND